MKKGPLSDGLQWVYSNGKYGFQNEVGKLVIPLQYDSVFSFTEGLAAVKKDTNWFYINKQDTLQIMSYDGHWRGVQYYKKARPFYHGRAVVRPYWRYDKALVITNAGPSDILGDFVADSIGDFVNGSAEIVQNNKHGVVDIMEDILVPIQYDDVDSFSNGWVKAKLKNRWFIVNPYGECMSNCPHGVKTRRKRTGDFQTIHFPNVQSKIALDEISNIQINNLIHFMQSHPNQRIILSGNGSSSYVGQQRSWDYVQFLVDYVLENSTISREQFIIQYGRNGEYRTVNIRLARNGEEGTNNLPPPMPSLMIK